jgi:hypothetical protein
LLLALLVGGEALLDFLHHRRDFAHLHAHLNAGNDEGESERADDDSG